jgi:copper chaperone CopZ
MTVKEKIEQEVNNENAIYLLKEGIFWRVYNRSAMRLVNNLKPLKINRKYIKNVEQDIFYCGFPETVLDKLNYTGGVVYCELDLDTKIVEVKYNSSKISADKVRKVISDLGYSADEVKADPQAQSALPKCCQPGGHD